MKIILTGLGEFGLDGEYEMESHPTGRELNRFRKEAELSPSELTDAIQNGALDVVRMYAYTAIARGGNATLAAKILDVPLDRLAGIEVDAEDGDEEDVSLPPTSGSALDESASSNGEPSGASLSGGSALPE